MKKFLGVNSIPGMSRIYREVGIWTKQNAPFLCIEPWCGLADSNNHNGDLEEKEGMNHLPAGEDFLRAIRIEILE